MLDFDFNFQFQIRGISLALFEVVFAICSAIASWILLRILVNHGEKILQPIREDGPQTHMLMKQSVPTLGGLVFIFVLAPLMFFIAAVESSLMQFVLVGMVGCGLIGLADDLAKLHANDSKGISARLKLIWQFAFCIAALISFNIDVIGDPDSQLQWFSAFPHWLVWLTNLVFMVFMINAVNITDGLDGLVIIPVTIIMVLLALIAFDFSFLSQMEYFDLRLLLLGAVPCFLVFFAFNGFPAKIFMGDTGSMALGGLLAFLAVALGQQINLMVVGMFLVVEGLSVMLQVGYFKYTRKKFGTGERLFKMAPFHHHLELLGYHEVKIAHMVWLMTLALASIVYGVYWLQVN